MRPETIKILKENIGNNFFDSCVFWGTWVAQLNICLLLSHDLRVLGLSPALGSLLSGEPASPSPSALPAPPPPAPAHTLTHSFSLYLK